jgi:nucleotide-binding universal stress UspA family protein
MANGEYIGVTEGGYPMSVFQSILLAYDGSESSKRAAIVSAELAGKLGARLEAVHALELPKPIVTVEASIITPPPDVDEGYHDDAWKLLEEARPLLAAAPGSSVNLLDGAPGPAIVDYAAEIGSDLIVIGHRGRSRLEELMMGSVSRYVTQHAKAAVLVVNSEARD